MTKSTAAGVSALILTFNEEVNIADCIRSLEFCDDVVVLDSFSTDRTVEIAEQMGARVYKREFDNYSRQRNHGLNEIAYRHPWLLMIDADERVPADLAREISAIAQGGDQQVHLYYLRFRAYFFGTWIKRSSGYPVWIGRLMRIGHVSLERAVHEQLETNGKIGYLEGHLEHYSFNKGMADWFAKHNRYSSLEAEELVRKQKLKLPWRDLFSADRVVRRRAAKAVVYASPGRPLLMFLGLYIVRGGFLEGRAGLTYCLLRAYYEFMINCKAKELKRRENGLPV